MRMGVKLGEKILRLRPDHDIDVVIPIPDTSRDAALEIANVLGVKYREGFIKNRYVGRTFIMPGQGERVKSVQAQAQPDPAGVQGPRRAAGGRLDRARHDLAADRADGARCRRAQGLPRLRRAAGALSRTSTASTCRRSDELVAHGRTEEEIEQLLGCDWLIYQDLADLEDAVSGPKHRSTQFDSLLLQRRVRHRHRAGLLRAHPASCARTRRRRSVARLTSPCDRHRVAILFDAARCVPGRPAPDDKLALHVRKRAQAFARGVLVDPGGRAAAGADRHAGPPRAPAAGASARLAAARLRQRRRARARFMHAVAHIEFNAIDLAWDAVYRFRGMPRCVLRRLDRASPATRRGISRCCASASRELRPRLRRLRRAQRPVGDGREDRARRPRAHGAGAARAGGARARRDAGHDRRSCVRWATPPPPTSSTSSCARKSRTSRRGHAGSAGVAKREGVEPASRFRQLLTNTARQPARAVQPAARMAAGFDEEEIAALEESAMRSSKERLKGASLTFRA